MKILSDYAHGILDYATVISFLLAPHVLGFGGIAAIISYALATVHLLMSLLTDMPLGAIKLIPMKLHAYVELCVAPVLIVGSFLLSVISSGTHGFFTIMGMVIFAIWLLSGYGAARRA
jgi:hypothetical protein